MKLKRNRSFPYPVLGFRRGIDSSANASLENSVDEDNYIWKITINHNNEDIHHLVKEGIVRYVCEVDAQSTYYRHTYFAQDDNTITVTVPRNEVGGRVNLTVTAVAMKPIKEYRNSRSSDFYAAYSFPVEEGDIIGIFGEWDINLDIEAKSYKRITSIIQLQLDETLKEEEVDLNDNKLIIIRLPKDKYEDHMGQICNPYFKPALLVSLVSNALIRAFHHYKDHEEKTWARILGLKAEDLGYTDLTDELLENPDFAYELTRKILDEPSLQLYNLLKDLEDESSDKISE